MRYILNKLNINQEIPQSTFERVKLAEHLDSIVENSYLKNKDNTKHYSEKFNVLLFDLIDNFDYTKEVIDPFAGRGDLLFTLDRFNSVKMYDINPDNDLVIKRDTLLKPLDFNDKYIITNPPYLARNKSQNKEIYDKYCVDDLYKASILSIINGNALGGCLIVPINFLTDENTENIRKEFFSKYHINNLNIFKKQMFEYTKYNTISFNFILGEQTQPIKTIIFSNNNIQEELIELKKEYGYRLYGEFYNTLPKESTVNRYYPLKKEFSVISNIYVHCIDGIKENSKIRAEYVDEIPVLKQSDRNTFLACFDKKYTKEEQLNIINEFNNFININREKYNNLLFTNFRENNRKRISFDLAYKILQKVIDTIY